MLLIKIAVKNLQDRARTIPSMPTRARAVGTEDRPRYEVFWPVVRPGGRRRSVPSLLKRKVYQTRAKRQGGENCGTAEAAQGLSALAALRLSVTGAGLEPAGTRLSTSPLCQFAYPVVAGPGVAPGGPGL